MIPSTSRGPVIGVYRWTGDHYVKVSDAPRELDVVLLAALDGRVLPGTNLPGCAGGSCPFGCTVACALHQPARRHYRRPRTTHRDSVQQPDEAQPAPQPADADEVSQAAPACTTEVTPPLPTLPERTGSWDAGWFAQQLAVFGARVRAIRQSREWSQRTVGDRTGIRRTGVSEIEAGRRCITLDTLWRLATDLQIHWADLLNDRDPTPPDTRGDDPTSFDQALAVFGMRVHSARKRQGLSQQTVHDDTGIYRKAFAGIEAGTGNITLKSLSRVAAALGVHWADLLDDRDPHPPRLTTANRTPRRPVVPARQPEDAPRAPSNSPARGSPKGGVRTPRRPAGPGMQRGRKGGDLRRTRGTPAAVAPNRQYPRPGAGVVIGYRAKAADGVEYLDYALAGHGVTADVPVRESD